MANRPDRSPDEAVAQPASPSQVGWRRTIQSLHGFAIITALSLALVVLLLVLAGNVIGFLQHPGPLLGHYIPYESSTTSLIAPSNQVPPSPPPADPTTVDRSLSASTLPASQTATPSTPSNTASSGSPTSQTRSPTRNSTPSNTSPLSSKPIPSFRPGPKIHPPSSSSPGNAASPRPASIRGPSTTSSKPTATALQNLASASNHIRPAAIDNKLCDLARAPTPARC
jgi:hypothetical protein